MPKPAEVTLFIRPRRFGKTLGMNMLAHFFDIREDSRELFQGLKISENRDLCENWMNQYPVVMLSFKNVDGLEFELALCWSGYEDCKIDFQLFQAFLQGYKNADGEMPIDWETLYDCNNGRLEWLEYNIKRVLGIDCGNDEKEIGIEQVKETIQHIIYYAKMKNQILEHCII